MLRKEAYWCSCKSLHSWTGIMMPRRRRFSIKLIRIRFSRPLTVEQPGMIWISTAYLKINVRLIWHISSIEIYWLIGCRSHFHTLLYDHTHSSYLTMLFFISFLLSSVSGCAWFSTFRYFLEFPDISLEKNLPILSFPHFFSDHSLFANHLYSF